MKDHEAQDSFEAIASPTADLHGQELQAWQQDSAAKLLVGLLRCMASHVCTLPCGTSDKLCCNRAEKGPPE